MPISYFPSTQTLTSLLAKLRNGRMSIPDHQRDFVWSISQQRKLVVAIQRHKPVPSVLLRELDDGSLSLEDGHQRFKTALRYIDNEFDVDGVYFRDMLQEQQRMFERYAVIVVTYSGATDEEAREIFNDYQNGKPLTFGERLYSMIHTSPIVRYAVTNIMTPGAHFHGRLASALGGERTPKGRRGSDMATAYALCAGMAFGVDHLSRKWEDASAVLHRDIDEEALNAKIEVFTRVWERVQELAPVLNKTRKNEYWNLGNFGGYIAYSIELHFKGEALKYNLPESIDVLVERWATGIAENHVRVDPEDREERESKLLYNLHRDLSSARSWKIARWSNGLRCMFNAAVETKVETDSDDDASEE